MGTKRTAKPCRHGKYPLGLYHITAYMLIALAAVSVVWYGSRNLYMHMLLRKLLENPVIEPPKGLQLNIQQHAADEMLLRQIVDECSERQDTVMYLNKQRQLVVTSSIDPSHCPVLDIMLRGAERGVGTCTDVALYVMHAGGRIIPLPADVDAYNSYCGAQTARLFLESMYGEFISKRKGVLHMQLLNSEHMWTRDAPLHAKMQAFLCKTHFCVDLIHQHIVRKRYWASVWFLGHTSSDPSIGVSGDVAAQLQQAIAHGKPKGYAIHVKGKSGLKQTKIVLECWSKHPEFPPLVVVGKASDKELSPAARLATNILYHPPVNPTPSLKPGQQQSQQDPATMLIDAAQLRNLQAAAAMHICPSVREGFGHYLNEARAVGALVLTVNHPPMNELITPQTGFLIPTTFTMSEKGTELGQLAHMNGHSSADGLCQVVQQALKLSAAEAEQKRAAVRAAYRAEKAAFLQRMVQLHTYLQARAAAAATGAPLPTPSAMLAMAPNYAAPAAITAAPQAYMPAADTVSSKALDRSAGGRRMGIGLNSSH